MKTMFVIFFILLILKLSGAVKISLLWVLAPFWLPVVTLFAAICGFLGVVFVLALLSGEVK